MTLVDLARLREELDRERRARAASMNADMDGRVMDRDVWQQIQVQRYQRIRELEQEIHDLEVALEEAAADLEFGGWAA